jgi:hypothetical protein
MSQEDQNEPLADPPFHGDDVHPHALPFVDVARPVSAIHRAFRRLFPLCGLPAHRFRSEALPAGSWIPAQSGRALRALPSGFHSLPFMTYPSQTDLP